MLLVCTVYIHSLFTVAQIKICIFQSTVGGVANVSASPIKEGMVNVFVSKGGVFSVPVRSIKEGVAFVTVSPTKDAVDFCIC